MTIQDAIRFANENPVCFLATVEKDQPRVRALAFWYADETGFYFSYR
jgi:pyridoxamine 5'-phosphate oxidase